MSEIKIPNIDYTRLITCVLYEGGSVEILEMLRSKGVNEACFYSVRGAPIGRSSEVDGLPEIPKTEILNVVVSADQADYIFEAIYDLAGLQEPQKGIITVNRLSRSSEINLPSDDEELKAA
jgi:nitrogen regulatory protein PII